ncbi:MAG: hypothetical protein P9L98_01650 [Candidatus Kaelpia imicola]|nr:hypothetical protein [Candidatus Kaelpia imicola]
MGYQQKNESRTLKEELTNFTGTEHYYRHWLEFNYTDGVKFLAEKANCFWLLDAIGSYQHKLKEKGFQIWTLKVNEDKLAVLQMQEDSDTPIIVKQEIEYTDFPTEEIKLYFINGVLLLTSEY